MSATVARAIAANDPLALICHVLQQGREAVATQVWKHRHLQLSADVALALRASAAIVVPRPENRAHKCTHGITATLSVLDAFLVLLRRHDHEALCKPMVGLLHQSTPVRPPVAISVLHPCLKGYRPNQNYRWSHARVFVQRTGRIIVHPRVLVIKELADAISPCAVAVRRLLKASHVDVWCNIGQLQYLPTYIKRVFACLSLGSARTYGRLPFELLSLIMMHVGFPIDFSHAALALH